ncbi:MFS transporter [Nocardioides baekrokdamisoli]|uniref:MFS transporter n=1 Tax=Nocardioides baekrokdamisoli TaxID=1804624 RepID=A0A3G9ICV2_9ACTN|nr:MFS transporter [Nocardioides baekrokdamisoli]BBH16790.1 MFS transporter [Nocardioides baekrokdamisoli]
MNKSARLTPQQRAWNWYDWANSAFYTTTLAVLFAPFMITVASHAAGCADAEDTCRNPVSVFGLHLAAGSLPSYLISFATISSALVLPVVGAFVDRSPRKKWHMAGYGWAASACAALLFFMQGSQWQLAAFAIVAASVLGGCSLVAYYAILVDISTEDERDAVSSRGWAWGYLGGGLLLLINLVMVQAHSNFGLSKELAVRLSLLSAAVWWAAFTIIPLVRLRNYAPTREAQTGSLMQRSFGQLFTTLKDMRAFPHTLTFLIAYLFYNDGIQTVIGSASTYGSKQLGMSQTVLISTILMIQFVAFGGALAFGRLAQRFGSYRPILWGTVGWMVIVVLAVFVPRGSVALFIALGVLIAIVMGGTQALSRSFFSLLIPRGREGEYFALYNACERGTSWFGTLLFGVVFQVTGSYRPAIVALIVFFILGAIFLLRVDPRRGIEEAGNRVPGQAFEALRPAS